MIFVGNMGMIQIHSGPVEKIMPMGPWINVMDPRFNLHLRADHVAEVWLVEKPTKIGPAVSIEAFDAQGALILQMFGRRDAEDTYAGVEQWNELVRGLPPVEMELA
jgi:putative hemin transport protein